MKHALAERPLITGRRLFDILAFLVPLTIYCASLSPYPDGWDYGEFETVPYLLGIAHPTGFPAYILLGWLFTHVVAIGTVAFRMKLLSALFVAGSAFLVRRLAMSFGAGGWPSLAAALAFGVTDIAWAKGAHADVHAMALFLTLVTFYYAMDFARTRNPRSLIFAGLAYGFGLATHPNVLWSGFALVPGIFSLARTNRRQLAFFLVALFAPLSVVFYIPIRSVVIDATHVDPASAPPISHLGDVDWEMTPVATVRGFFNEISGHEVNASGTLGELFDFVHYPDFLAKWFAAVSPQIELASIGLGILGFVSLVRVDPKVRTGAVWIVAAAFAALPFTYSYSVESDTTRYVFASLAVVLALAACAADALVIRKSLGRGLVTVALLLVAWTTYRGNVAHYAWRDDRNSQPIIDFVARSTPSDATVLTVWLDLTPLGYGAYIDHSLGDRIPLQFLGEHVEDYKTWSKTRHVYVLTNFLITDEVRRDFPATCLHEVPSFDTDHHLFEVRCTPSS